MTSAVAAAIAVATVCLGLAVVSDAHGLEGVPDPPGSELCVCSAIIDGFGVVDPCSTGSYYSAVLRSGPGITTDPKLVAIVKLERLIARLRWELTQPP